MKHLLAGLHACLRTHDSSFMHKPRAPRGHLIAVRMTLDIAHAMPLRQALTRDCEDLTWTMRMTSIRGTNRVRFVLYLYKPGSAITRVFERMKQFLQEETHPLVSSNWNPPVGSALLGMQSPLFGSPVLVTRPASADPDTIGRLLIREHVLLGLEVIDRESLFTRVAQFLEPRCGLRAAEIKARLLTREALGSTGLGQGVAVPHVQMKGLRQAFALYVRPFSPIPFDAPDGKPVSDFVMLFVPHRPEMLHLQLLAQVAERFCDQRFCEQLHACTQPDDVCKVFSDFDTTCLAHCPMQNG
jgi:nitrogen PTS system EIIA component